MKRVLIADDSAIIRKTLQRMFEQEGWSICGEASNGAEAIAKTQELRPDIVVLDLSMPVMNGLTAARILKRTVPDSHLILFTAFDDLISTDQLRGAGFSALIPKSEAGRLISTAQNLFNIAHA